MNETLNPMDVAYFAITGGYPNPSESELEKIEIILKGDYTQYELADHILNQVEIDIANEEAEKYIEGTHEV